MRKLRRWVAGACLPGLLLGLAACGLGQQKSGGATTESLVIGTTDKVVSIDPAGSYDNGSLLVQNQVFSYLLNFPEGAKTPQPDAAEKCEFTKPKKYTCTMKTGLTFANGNPLTAESVAFSFKRIAKINDPSGPAALLTNMKSVKATDADTVEFTLNSPNDQTFPQVLVTSAGPIVDEKTFPADRVLSDDEVVESKGTSGPYTIGKYQKNQLAEFLKNDKYEGALGEAQTPAVTMKYYTDSNNLKLEIQNNDIDIAFRSLTPTDVESLRNNDDVVVHTGDGGELRFVVMNLKSMPGKNAEQKLAVRQALAATVDREALSTRVYKGTYTPAYSPIPEGQVGATEAFKEVYGAKPNVKLAKQTLADAGVEVPVTVPVQWNPDHYGSSSGEEYNALKRQWESTGLFTVDLQSTEWTTYAKERTQDLYPVYQLGWFPDFPDADNYVTPFLAPNNALQSHYEDDAMTKLLDQERTEADPEKRAELLARIQTEVAEEVPLLPLLTGAQVAISGTDVSGVDKTLDSTFKFRFTSLGK